MNYRNDWERNSVESIREVMEQDFAFAMNNLPLREENNSKISGAMARHYLGELYLAMDQPSKAVEVLKPLAEGSEYSLITNRFGKNSRQSGLSVHRRIPHTDVCGRKHGGFIRFCQHGTENSAFGTAEVYMKSTYKNYYSNDGVINKSNKYDPDYTSGAATWPQVFWINNGGKVPDVACLQGVLSVSTTIKIRELRTTVHPIMQWYGLLTRRVPTARLRNSLTTVRWW